jgi:hypothetical protein
MGGRRRLCDPAPGVLPASAPFLGSMLCPSIGEMLVNRCALKWRRVVECRAGRCSRSPTALLPSGRVSEWVSALRLRDAAKTSSEAKRSGGGLEAPLAADTVWYESGGGAASWRWVMVWGGGVRMAAHCNATQRLVANQVSGALCESPTGAAVAARRVRWLSSLAVVLTLTLTLTLTCPSGESPRRRRLAHVRCALITLKLSLKLRRPVAWFVAWRSRNQDAPNRPLCRRWIRSCVAGAAPSISLADEAEEPGG